MFHSPHLVWMLKRTKNLWEQQIAPNVEENPFQKHNLWKPELLLSIKWAGIWSISHIWWRFILFSHFFSFVGKLLLWYETQVEIFKKKEASMFVIILFSFHGNIAIPPVVSELKMG